MELSKILKDEAWLEAERRGKVVPLSDQEIFDKSVKIWEELYDTNAQKYENFNEYKEYF